MKTLIEQLIPIEDEYCFLWLKLQNEIEKAKKNNMKPTILKQIESWSPKKKPLKVKKQNIVFSETPKPINYREWISENNSQ
jgi:hypothetical protein